MDNNGRKIIYSGIQPTGCVTIGNYIGAINNWKKLQENNDCIYGIANMHALTVRQDPAEFRARVKSFFAQYLACGLDPDKSIIYIQSDVAEHAELTWVLNCFTYLGELSRMTQFKDKSAKNEDNINSGLLTYPILMAADILLYKTDLVPVGIDQKQHLELTRDIAARFNNIYGDVFTVPEPYIPEQGAKITSLQNPLEKMSKSDPDPNGMVSIIDAPDVIMRKFKRAVTDSGTGIYVSPEKPGITNLLTIYSVFADCPIREAEGRFEGKGYGEFKTAVGEAVVDVLKPVNERYKDLMNNKDYLDKIAAEGADKARYIAKKTMSKVMRKVGFR
ncbi:MAG: tryptophan--tRNA ligase [Clostridia bacterium]|nr:tryptophan--tRNA ligase [Clostridia bacterium]